MAKQKKQKRLCECSRCGNCCQDVGRTFWKSIYLDKELLCCLTPQITKRLHNKDHEDGNMRCEMLFEDVLETTCLLERDCGVKPSSCRNHQGDDRCIPLRSTKRGLVRADKEA